MVINGPIVISQSAVKKLVIIQSVLSGLQMLSAASVLGDFVGARAASLFIVLVAAVQQGVNTFISKSVAEAVSHVQQVVDRAEVVTEQASATVTAFAATLPPESAASVLLEDRRQHDG